jgi:hypothetical protein
VAHHRHLPAVFGQKHVTHREHHFLSVSDTKGSWVKARLQQLFDSVHLWPEQGSLSQHLALAVALALPGSLTGGAAWGRCRVLASKQGLHGDRPSIRWGSSLLAGGRHGIWAPILDLPSRLLNDCTLQCRHLRARQVGPDHNQKMNRWCSWHPSLAISIHQEKSPSLKPQVLS